MIRAYEDKIIDRVTYNQVIDRTYKYFTDIEAAVLVLLEMGYTPLQIVEHFEWKSHQNVYHHMKNIKTKIKAHGGYEE